MVAKSFPRKLGFKKTNFRKIIWSTILYNCKIISLNSGMQEKVLRKCLIVAKSFTRKHICKNKCGEIFWQKFFDRNFLWLKNDFLQNSIARKKFEKNILVEKFDWLHNNFLQNRFVEKKVFEKIFKVQNHFFENGFEEKNFCEIVLVENFL